MAFHVPEQYRVQQGQLASSRLDGNNGAFVIRSQKLKYPLSVIASDGLGWDHVSVSTPVRCPTWQEMCFIKDLFWDEEDAIVQFHPPKSLYVNNHPFCLHLWRNQFNPVVLPDPILVGVR